ncbi:MAG: PilZ domain-containing protein [Methylococcaceae bacterium]|nr:PilZ domain-containing protein [Methylococcaceae bacterium]
MTENDISDYTSFNFDLSNQFRINKRIGVRYPAPKVTLTLLKKKLLLSGNKFSGQLLDISAKGLLINCTEPLNKNTILAIKLLFTDGTLFNLQGKVVREKARNQYGIEFDHYNQVLDEYLFKLLATSLSGQL